jgi:D-tyrosyl-tRNA(Tyr) deacylase
MRAVVQRVSRASVAVEAEVAGSIGRGLLVLLGVAQEDTEAEAAWLAAKVAALRIFPDEAGQMNRSLLDVGGEALVVSQFTLFGDVNKGTRPSFNRAARPDAAIPLYEAFVRDLSGVLGRPVATGRFGAMMQVELVNDGPVTLVIER